MQDNMGLDPTIITRTKLTNGYNEGCILIVRYSDNISKQTTSNYRIDNISA